MWLVLLAMAPSATPVTALEFRQNVAFSTGNQSLWAPGQAVNRTFVFDDLRAELDAQIPSVNFDPVKSALQLLDGLLGTGVADLLGVGVSVGGGISGEAGIEFGYHVNGGLFHMNYPGRSSLDFATYAGTGAIASGRDNRISTAFLPGLSAPIDPSRGIGSPLSIRGGGGYDVRDLPGAGFETFQNPSFGTQFPNASAWADMYVNASASATMEVNALFEKFTVRVPGIDVNERVRLAEVNPTGIYVGGIDKGISFGQPINLPGVGQVTLSYPDVTVTSTGPDGAGVLRGSASKPIVSLQAQLEKLVPVVGAFLSNKVGPFGYTIVETLGGPTLNLYQDVSFTPQPRVELAFSKPVLRRMPNGSLEPTNLINVALGESLDIQPMFGSSSVIDVQPTYYLNNTFTNQIGLSLGVDFDIDALKLMTPVGNLGPALHKDLTFSDLARIPVGNFQFQMPMTPVHARRFVLSTVNPTTLIDGASLTLQSSQLLSSDPVTGRETHRFVANDAATMTSYTFDVTGTGISILGAPELDVQFALVADSDVIVTHPQTGQPVANLGRHLCYACDYDYSEFFADPIDLVTPEGTLFVNPFFDFTSGIVDTSGDPNLNGNNYYHTSNSVEAVLDPITTEPVAVPPGVLFSNLNEPHRDATPIGVGPGDYWAAQSFYTGDSQYALRSIRAMVAATGGSPDVVAGLYKFAEGEFTIGELVAVLTPQELTSDGLPPIYVPPAMRESGLLNSTPLALRSGGAC
ncbi:hypothetical protein [Botrimarina hoheduenensis]|uniref:Uncharacterized protein n=1 Tax=Botrimarina hoheduenensis TaxID=2528000 RepID=A0A5C5VY83_9BACT|nr:hypothetical protein [Botrimarina hoheduenensis]TWT42975.1 hypothetical protein Pla111_26130 [Botrimarina hoheduenensis]